MKTEDVSDPALGFSVLQKRLLLTAIEKESSRAAQAKIDGQVRKQSNAQGLDAVGSKCLFLPNKTLLRTVSISRLSNQSITPGRITGSVFIMSFRDDNFKADKNTRSFSQSRSIRIRLVEILVGFTWGARGTSVQAYTSQRM